MSTLRSGNRGSIRVAIGGVEVDLFECTLHVDLRQHALGGGKHEGAKGVLLTLVSMLHLANLIFLLLPKRKESVSALTSLKRKLPRTSSLPSSPCVREVLLAGY